MKEVPFHILPLLVATAVRFAMGAAWFSPALFGKTWSKLTGTTDKQMKQRMGRGMLADAIGGFVLSFVLVHSLAFAGANTFQAGAICGFFNWLGFIAMPMLALVTWEGKPLKQYAIQTGYQLASLLVIGAGLAVYY